MTIHNNIIMTKIKHIVGIFCLLLLGIGLSGCLEKDLAPGTHNNRAPFALYKMNVTFIDAESKEAISGLQVVLLGHTEQTVLTTDAFGKAQVLAVASPPTPRVFDVSYTDPEKRYRADAFHITFTNPIFKLSSDDKLKQDPLYQGMAEINIIKELTPLSL